MSKYIYKRQTAKGLDALKNEDQERIFCDEYRKSINAWVEGMKAEGYTMEQINAIFNEYVFGMFYGQSPW